MQARAMTTVVSTSDRHNASQMPCVPNALGNKINEGTRKINPRSSANRVAGFTRSMLW